MEFSYYTYENPLLIWGIVIAVSILIIWWAIAMECTSRERKYIKMEMERSFDRGEYRYWEKQLTRLNLRCLPIIGLFIRK